MASKTLAKSILKQSTPETKQTTSDEQKELIERDRRNLAIALHHANKIQAQKDVEARILNSIEDLLSLPSDSSSGDAGSSQFRSLVALFQPSDFDSLVEERTSERRCGYALCSRSPRSATLGPSAAWKLEGNGTGDYCSNRCVRKALYVKSQLNEVPAWERAFGEHPTIELHEDLETTAKVYRPAVDDNARWRAAADQQDLALERGETATSFRPKQVMADTIVEKATKFHKQPAHVAVPSTGHAAIEGYVPLGAANQSAKSSHNMASTDDAQDATVTYHKYAEDVDEAESWGALYENIREGSATLALRKVSKGS